MKILCIGAHIDECEYGVGGVSALLVQEGHVVRFVNPATFLHVEEARRDEMKAQSDAAAAALGVEKSVWMNEQRAKTWLCDIPNVMRIQNEIETFKPDILFMQWSRDNHPEHAEVARASYLALSNALTVKVHEVYAYEAGPNQTMNYFIPDFTIDITEAFGRVADSLRCFSTTRADGDRLVREKELCNSFRGHQNHQKLAEAFRIVKYPDDGDDFLLRQFAARRFRWCGNRQYPAMGREYF